MDLVDRADWLGMPSVVLGELWIGFLLGGLPERNKVELERFLAHPIVEELGMNHEVAQIYAEISVSLRRAGTPIPTNDIWVAASAAYAGAQLLTYDDHFRNIQTVNSVILPTTSYR